MARVSLSPRQQVTRISKIAARFDKLKNNDIQVLTTRTSEKSWSVIEVIEHMNIAQEVYENKINSAMASLPQRQTEITQIKASAIPSFLIKRFPPKEGKIRFKMKTMNVFKPVLDVNTITDSKVNHTLTRFQEGLSQLKEWVNQYATKDVTSAKFNSAVGAWVKFNVAEACEFILCHNERHMQQIENTLRRV